MIDGLPWEGWLGLACGVLFLVVLIHAICAASKDADESREQACRNFEGKAHDSYRERRAEQLGSEAEAFLRGTARR